MCINSAFLFMKYKIYSISKFKNISILKTYENYLNVYLYMQIYYNMINKFDRNIYLCI